MSPLFSSLSIRVANTRACVFPTVLLTRYGGALTNNPPKNRFEISVRAATLAWTRPRVRPTCTNRADCIPAIDRAEIRYNRFGARAPRNLPPPRPQAHCPTVKLCLVLVCVWRIVCGALRAFRTGARFSLNSRWISSAWLPGRLSPR